MYLSPSFAAYLSPSLSQRHTETTESFARNGREQSSNSEQATGGEAPVRQVV
jgi:hypothetical protein